MGILKTVAKAGNIAGQELMNEAGSLFVAGSVGHHMLYKLILAMLFFASLVEAAEPNARCRESEALVFKNPKTNAYQTADVEIFATTLTREGCDDGVYAEQATEVVCRALVNDFAGVIKFGNSSETARTFILHHINASAGESDLVLITKKRGNCFVANSSLCQDVIAAAEKSLQSMYKKGRSFDRKPNTSKSN
jgi:hypothetical protein